MNMDNFATLKIRKNNVKPSIYTRCWHRIQERIRPPFVRKIIAKHFFGYFRQLAFEEDTSITDNLRSKGYALFPGFISPEKATELRIALEGLPCFDPWTTRKEEFNILEAPVGTHVAQIKLGPMMRELHNLAMNQSIINTVSKYFGCRFYLDSIQAWWSLPGNSTPEEAEYYHRDNDSIQFLKFFIYLSEVNEHNGPNIFIEGSHRSNKLLQRRRLTDEEVKRNFSDKCIIFKGCAGDGFIEDTYGIHKGLMPIKGPRLLLQFRYSVTETVFRSTITYSGLDTYPVNKIRSLISDD